MWIGKFSPKRLFTINESLKAKISRVFYVQNTSCVVQKEKNNSTYSNNKGIQKSRLNFNYLKKNFLVVIILSLLSSCSLFDWGKDYCTESPPYGFPVGSVEDASFSPDAEKVVFCYQGNKWGTDTVGLYLYDIEKDSIYPFIVKLPPFLVSSPSFSPDGEWIVFCWSAQIWKIKEDTDSLTQLTSSGSNFFPRWSPDGKLISHDKTTDSMGVWIINSDGAPVKHIYIYGRYPSWNPSGDKILFVGYNGGGGSIASIDTTGENFNRILKESDINAVALHYPRYSPGGSKIVFCAQREGEGRMVWVMEADGSNPVALAAGNMPDWSPDGRKIIYSNNKVGGIWIMDTNGCNKEILIDEFN